MVAHRTPYDDGSHRNDEGAPSGPKVPLTPILHDAYDLMRRTPKPLQWLVPDIFPRYCIAVGADAKAGKTQLFATCALKIATSHPEVGTPPKVLIVAPDSTDLDEWCETINDKLEGTPVDRGRLVVWTEGVPELGEGLLETVEAILDSDRAFVAVIVDVWNSVKPSKRGEDDVQKRDHKRMRTFADLAERRDIGVALLCHTNVHGQIAGSMGLRGGVHGLMMLEREKVGDIVSVDLFGRRIKNPGHIRFKFDLNELSTDWEPHSEDEKSAGVEDLAQAYEQATAEHEAEAKRKLPHEPGPVERRMIEVMQTEAQWEPKQLAQESGLPRVTVRVNLRRMLQRGQVWRIPGGIYGLVTGETPETLRNIQDSQAGNEAPVTSVTSVTTPVTPGHPWARECMGQCLRRVKPASGEACPRCNLVCWEHEELGGAPLYICRHCHPRSISNTEEEAGEGEELQATQQQPEAGAGADLGADRAAVDAIPGG